MPEGEDGRFECSIQRGAPSPCSLLALKGPRTSGKVLQSGCSHWDRKLMPMVACGKAATLKTLMWYCQKSKPQVRGALECLQFNLYYSIWLTNQELHSIVFPLLSFEPFFFKLWVQKFNYRPWCSLITPKEEWELRAQLHSAVTLYLR